MSRAEGLRWWRRREARGQCQASYGGRRGGLGLSVGEQVRSVLQASERQLCHGGGVALRGKESPQAW